MITSDGYSQIEFKCSEAGTKYSPKNDGKFFICEDPSIICRDKTACLNDCHYRYILVKIKKKRRLFG